MAEKTKERISHDTVIESKSTIAEDFYHFVNKKKLLIFFVWIFTVSIYGAWMTQNLVTFDAEGFYSVADGTKWYEQWYQLGRWMLVLMKMVMGVSVVNPFFQVTVFALAFPLSAFLWLFCFYRWNEGREDKLFAVVFLCVYLSHPIWALQFSYRNQMETIAIAMLFLPLAMVLLTDKDNDCRWGKVFLSAVLVIAAFGSYQSFMFVYAGAVIIYFIFQLSLGYGEDEKKLFWQQIGLSIAFTGVCYIVYSGISHGVCVWKGLEYGSDYLQTQFLWGKQLPAENVMNILRYLKKALMGDGVIYNALGIICVLGGVIVLYSFREHTHALWLVLCLYIASWWIPFTLLFVTASDIVGRSQFCFVFMLAFWTAFEISVLHKSLFRGSFCNANYIVVTLLLACLVIPQMEKTTRLLYSDYMTMYTDEVSLWNIYYSALAKGAREGDAIVFIGGKSNYQIEAMKENEVVGYSYFEVNGNYGGTKIIEAMRAYGMNVSNPTDIQVEYASQIARGMEVLPSADGITVANGIIIVRLS